MTRTTLISTLASLAILAASAASAQAQAPSAQTVVVQTANLTVTFSGITQAKGAIMMAMFDSQAAYEGDDAKPVQAVVIPVTGSSVSAAFQGLAPGSYAIKLYHDVNGDGKMGSNPFGMPTEPYAFSNNAKGNMGPAKWAAAAFSVVAGANTQSITID